MAREANYIPDSGEKYCINEPSKAVLYHPITRFCRSVGHH